MTGLWGRALRGLLLLMGGAALAVLGGCSPLDGGPERGDALGLAVFDCCSEGAPLDDGVPYFSYSVSTTVDAGLDIELIGAEVAGVEGPVQVDGVFVLGPSFEQIPFDAPESERRRLLADYRVQELSRLGECGAPTCEVFFAIVARRIASDAPGVVRGVDVRYRLGEEEYVETTTFAVGLCLPESTDDCTQAEDAS